LGYQATCINNIVLSRKIRILECIRQGKVGGGESYLLSLIEHMDRERFEPIVLSFTDGQMMERLAELNVRTHIIHTERPFDWRVWGQVKQLMIDEQIDIVHAHGTRANSNVFRSAKQLNLPIVYTCHAWSFHPGQSALVNRLRILSERFLVRQADVNVCGALASRESGRKHFGTFNPEIIYNSIDQDRFNPGNEFKPIREELNIGKDEVIVISIARFTKQKQPQALVKAFAKVAALHSNVRLVMVGDGEDKDETVALAQTLGISDRIIFQPFRQDVADLLAASDIYVLPSLWEAFSIALLEALYMGKAVVATNVDGTPEAVTDGVNGLLVSPDNLIDGTAEAISKLVADPELRKQMQQKAHEMVYGKYNAEDMAKGNERVYETLFNNKHPKSSKVALA